jgi:hypothetical protein
MRTTLDIEDDLLTAAKEIARREKSTAGKVLSELARRGLAAPGRRQRGRSAVRGGVPILPSRGEIITLEHIEKIRDEEGV